jgi:hypothetical protein
MTNAVITGTSENGGSSGQDALEQPVHACNAPHADVIVGTLSDVVST